jgi:hypothetical protein
MPVDIIYLMKSDVPDVHIGLVKDHRKNDIFRALRYVVVIRMLFFTGIGQNALVLIMGHYLII